MPDCIFCKIINKEIPTDRASIFEDADFLVIFDKFPKAETHILLMPKKHIHSIGETSEADQEILGRLLVLAAKIAREKGIVDFKLVFNNGKYAEILHLHVHLVAEPDLKAAAV